jgi:hypothetical protein
MSIYQGIQNFGKKAILVGGLVFLTGCESEKPDYWKPRQAVVDVNGDNKNDIVSSVGIGHNCFGGPRCYHISVALNKGDGTFGEMMPVLRVPRNLDDIKIEDIDWDGKKDLLLRFVVYRRDNFFDQRYHQLMVAYGIGNGTFTMPQKLLDL